MSKLLFNLYLQQDLAPTEWLKLAKEKCHTQFGVVVATIPLTSSEFNAETMYSCADCNNSVKLVCCREVANNSLLCIPCAEDLLDKKDQNEDEDEHGRR